MQDQFTRTPRRRATVRRRGGSAASFRSARSSAKTTRAWRSRIVEGLVQAQPLRVYLDRACRSAPRYRRRSWWLDTSTTAQSRRAVKRWHGCAQDLWRRNVEIAAWCALGATQAHVGAKYSLTRQRVGQIVREFPWVREAVLGRLEGRDENHGREGGKCQSSLRGWVGSDSAELEGVDRCSGEFRPLSRPNQARWRRICDRRGAGSRRRRKGTRPRRAGGPGGGLTGLCRRFPLPPVGGESASSAPAGRGGKVPVQPPPEGGGKCQFSPRRKGGESASFSGGDQPPLAASRRGDLAAAEIADPGPARSSGAVWSPALPGSAGAVLTGNRER